MPRLLGDRIRFVAHVGHEQQQPMAHRHEGPQDRRSARNRDRHLHDRQYCRVLRGWTCGRPMGSPRRNVHIRRHRDRRRGRSMHRTERAGLSGRPICNRLRTGDRSIGSSFLGGRAQSTAVARAGCTVVQLALAGGRYRLECHRVRNGPHRVQSLLAPTLDFTGSPLHRGPSRRVVVARISAVADCE
jgi:hypothetical protein